MSRAGGEGAGIAVVDAHARHGEASAEARGPRGQPSVVSFPGVSQVSGIIDDQYLLSE